MGVRLPSGATNVIANTNVVTTAETVVATLGPLNISLDFAAILLFWYIAVGTGAATTSITMRLRRGSTTGGAVVNLPQNINGPLNSTIALGGCYFDVPGAIAGQQYSLTYQQNGATGNGTVLDVALIAMSL